MSEQEKRIDPALDGSGGGYGRFRGMTVREVSQSFAKIAEDPNMRSVTGILRICREQLDTRAQLSVSSTSAIVLGVVTLGLIVALFFIPASIRPGFAKGIGVSGILFAGFLSGAVSTRKMTRAAIAQDRAIRELATEALEQVVTHPDFKPKPLDSIQRQTLKQILTKVEGNHVELKQLLDQE